MQSWSLGTAGQLHAFLRPSGRLEGPDMPVSEPPAQLCTQLLGRVQWPGPFVVVRGPLWRCQPSPMVGALFSGELAALRGGEVAAQPVDQQDPGVSTAGPTGTVRAPLALVSLQASFNGMTHQGRDSPEHSGDALHVGWPWGILWVRGRKEEGLGSFPRKGWARGLYSSLSPVSVLMPRTRRCRGSRQLAGGPSGGRSQSPRWVPR